MRRRDFVKTGLCLLGCGWGCAPLASMERKDSRSPSAAAKAKVFPFELELGYLRNFDTLRYWLHWMLERLGKDTAIGIWNAAFREPAGELTERILADGWEPCKPVKSRSFSPEFPDEVEGLSRAQAVETIEKAPNMAAMKKRFPDLRVKKQITSVDAMHLIFDEGARLTEEMIRSMGKQGELIAYDIVRSLRIYRASQSPQKVADFMRQTAAFGKSQVPTLFSAGLEMEIIKATDSEFIARMKRCAWAEYFRKNHPSVGYLLACSTDDADYRATNQTLRMQRTSTLMQGGPSCDFRIYSVKLG